MAARKAKTSPQAKAKTKAKTRLKAKAKAAPKAKAKAAPKAKATPKPKAAPKTKAAPKPKAAPKAKATPKPKAAPKAKATPARDAVIALARKKTIANVLAPVPTGKEVVDAYMRDVDHPFKNEMEAVRAIILGASSKMAERIKWNAPSFFYGEDFGAFHPRATEYAHLIVLFPGGVGIPTKSSLLEGTQKDRREAKFHSLDDVKAKKTALEKLVKQWVQARG